MRSLQKIAEETLLDINQLREIERIILEHKQFSKTAVRQEIDWFFSELGMPSYYFETTPLKTISAHIEALKAAEIMASVKAGVEFDVDLKTESKNEALYLVVDEHNKAMEIERRIENKYPDFRVQSYRTLGKTSERKHLRMYLVYKPKIQLDKIRSEETDLKKIAGKDFLETTTKRTYERYQRVMEQTEGWETPLIEVSLKKETNEQRIMVVCDRDSSSRFFSNISDVVNSYDLVTNRKYIEQFTNGKTVYVFYLDKVKSEKMLENIIEDISLVYVIPESPLLELFKQRRLSAQEMVFGVSAWSFAHQFLTGYNEEYVKLSDALKESPELLGTLRTLKVRLAKDTYTETKVWDSFLNNHYYLKVLYGLFDKKFNTANKNDDINKDLSEVEKDMMRRLPTDSDREIFNAVVTFIKVIQRTNFYKEEKTSISFMYDTRFLNKVDYPETPFGIFQVIGMEFRGFHIRFRDIARGGIRIVKSSDYQNYLNNSDFIFDENYNLALTQQKKNKDIPEGGSKGTILLRWGYNNKAETAFKKYINGLLDLLVEDKNIKDFYGKEAILFLGPDEGTADLMEWASSRAKVLGYPYWKAFSTGKPLKIGGIPHDLYGMTTHSVHQFVLESLSELGLKEEDMAKVMTGGPDGDLGSNEILISKDRILAIVDGSGVLYDPEGINRDEMERLAKLRKPIANFKKRLISSKGFLVTIEDNDIKLKNGTYIVSGLEFRNSFHLDERFRADLFVPCGGRPSSININNWKKFIDKNGIPRFKIISEGANLFITQDARLRLEENGVILYKDASANKGGVTSSSMEVFASLALSDREHDKWMCVHNDIVTPFREQYIEQILRIIKENASFEFDLIEKEHKRTNIPRAVLTEMISDKINKVTDAVYSSELYKNEEFFKDVLKGCCPDILMKQVGFDAVMERVPRQYLRAIFASRLASRYVYMYGLEANEIDFHNYVNLCR
jgi:glutamate dehydrogenase